MFFKIRWFSNLSLFNWYFAARYNAFKLDFICWSDFKFYLAFI